MSEKTNTSPLSAQEELMRRLKSIGVDLWGGGTAEEAVERDFAAEAAPGTSKKEPASSGNKPAGKETEAKKKPVSAKEKVGIENLWITADETIDWTEALLRESPRDGLTSPRIWSFYHRMAEKVLSGSTEAYAEVLTTLNPLGDLTEYVSGMVLRTPGADRVECEFECQPEDLEKYGRDYLGALSLRIARDLLAALPVTEVRVTGNLNGENRVEVTFRREQLLKRKMAFLKPADFVTECGGTIA